MKNLLSIIFVFVFSLSIFGQNSSADWQKVPGNFQNDDFEEVYGTLTKSPNFIGKDKSETTSDYKKRVAGLSKIALPSKLGDKLLAIVYHPKVEGFSDSVTAKYDADAQKLQITIKTHHIFYVTPAPEKLIKITGVTVKDTQLTSLGSYERENAFGVKYTIKKTLLTDFSIGINNIASLQGLDSSSFDPAFKLLLSVAPVKAKEIKENLAILYVGNLVAPFTVLSGLELKPTMDKPRHAYLGDKVLIMNLAEIWIFNNLTGEVVSKIKQTGN
jgi:hypothetical protein